MNRVSGAPEGINLKPVEATDLLDELERWEAFLRSDPKLVSKLRSLDKPARGLCPIICSTISTMIMLS